MRGRFAQQHAAPLLSRPSRANLDALTELIESGKIAPAFDSRCSLEELPNAIRELDDGTRRGKVLVEAAPG